MFDKIRLFVVGNSLFFCLSLFLSIIKILNKKKVVNISEYTDGIVFLVTGRFYSDNWIMSHLLPLSMADNIKKIIIVTDYAIGDMNNVDVIHPPSWLIRLCGSTPARLITFIKIGFQQKPQLIGGFHLLLNGLVSLLLARLVGAKALYNCGGGIREVAGGGYSTENRIFKTLGKPNKKIELQLLEAVSLFDFIVVRGTRAAAFFAPYVSRNKIHIVTGGIDGDRFCPVLAVRSIDLIITGRISDVKRIDIFIQSVKCATKWKPDISAIIIGDGPLKNRFEKMVDDLGLSNNVRFVGYQNKVEQWLQQAKIFVLTSDSEGLSLALIEAMLCGLPAVVSSVGDLADLVEHGVNGYLVVDRRPENFALFYKELLNNKKIRLQMGKKARLAAKRCELKHVRKLWSDIFKCFAR